LGATLAIKRHPPKGEAIAGSELRGRSRAGEENPGCLWEARGDIQPPRTDECYLEFRISGKKRS